MPEERDSGPSPIGESSMEEMPSGATQIFGDRIELAQRYAQHLATTGVEWGLIGPRELPRLWSRHILNCALVAQLIAPDDTVGDVGSGAGLPGLPIALALPQTLITLIEPMERRVEWLRMVIDDLQLDNVRVVRARVEDLVDEEMFTVVTARAVKALKVLAGWCAPVIAPEGRLLAMKGEKASEEITAAAKTLKKLRMTPATLHVLENPAVSTPTRVVESMRR